MVNYCHTLECRKTVCVYLFFLTLLTYCAPSKFKYGVEGGESHDSRFKSVEYLVMSAVFSLSNSNTALSDRKWFQSTIYSNYHYQFSVQFILYGHWID